MDIGKLARSLEKAPFSMSGMIKDLCEQVLLVHLLFLSISLVFCLLLSVFLFFSMLSLSRFSIHHSIYYAVDQGYAERIKVLEASIDDKRLLVCHGESWSQKECITNKNILMVLMQDGFSDCLGETAALTKALRKFDIDHLSKLSKAANESARGCWAKLEAKNLVALWSYFSTKLCKSAGSHNHDMDEVKRMYFNIIGKTPGQNPVQSSPASGAIVATSDKQHSYPEYPLSESESEPAQAAIQDAQAATQDAPMSVSAEPAQAAIQDAPMSVSVPIIIDSSDEDDQGCTLVVPAFVTKSLAGSSQIGRSCALLSEII